MNNNIISVTEQLNKPLGKIQVNQFVNVLLQKPEYIDVFITILEKKEKRLSMNTAWILASLNDEDFTLLLPYFHRFIAINKQTKSDSVRRNTTKIIGKAMMHIPKDEILELGDLYDLCVSWMVSENFAIAVRCNAMSIVANFCLLEPELISETIEQIEFTKEYTSTGFKSRSTKLINQLQKFQNKNLF
ncbi:MAG: hypothetical protein LBM67_04370 [Lentimicrobiaceae bacterium]|jgi:hypothetical protein|nr:hypothetical protein [Lentimicrobiaceae bacterium]